MASSWIARHLSLVVLLILASLLAGLFLLPNVPASRVVLPATSGDACAHVLKAASNGSGPSVECFLNGTGSFTWEPNILSVPANATIIFAVGSIGPAQHNFTLGSVSNDTLPTSWTSDQLYAYYNAHHPLVQTPTLNSTGTSFVTRPVHMPAHGIFEYVCEYPGHFQSGMYGFLYVGVQAAVQVVTPSITLPVQTGLLVVAFFILAASTVLILNSQSRGILPWMSSVAGKVRGAVSRETDPRTLRSWIFTTDHKRIGILYLVTAMYFFAMAGSFAEMMRDQLSVPNNTVVGASIYDQLVSMHGLLMALFVISPLGFAFANYFIPLQIGARDMSFPRLNALSYWLFLFGGILLLSGIFLPGGAVSSGWTIYAPLSENQFLPQPGMDAAVAGIILVIGSMVLGTINIATTIARQRTKGFRLMDMPMFTWSLIFTLFMAWFAFPDLAAALSLLTLDRTIGSTIFLSNSGGALLWQQVFWFFGHPEVYILIFPAFGAMYDIASVFSGRPIYGKKYIIYSMAAIAGLSMMVWLHHMFMSGVNLGWLDIQSITTGAISIPSDTMVLGLMLTVQGGRIRYKAPMLFTMGAIPLFIVGGLTGVLTSVPALDIAFHGSYWIVGHFHYMLAGTALWGLSAAMYYWFPKMTGRMYSEGIAKVHFVVAAVGINLLYAPMFFLYNMPRRYFAYSTYMGFDQMNLISSIGAVIYGLAQVIFLINLAYSLYRGPVASRNPWGAWSFEWLTSSPPPPENFDGEPRVEGDRLVILPTHARHHGPKPSLWPFLVGLGAFASLTAFLLDVTWGFVLLLPLGLAVLVGSMVGWALEDYSDRVDDADTGVRETWPFTHVSNVQLGTMIFIGGDLAFIGALVGAYSFVTLQAPYFNDPILPPRAFQDPSINILLLSSLLVSSATSYLALDAARARKPLRAKAFMVATIALGSLFLMLTLENWQFMGHLGMGLSAVSTSLSASMFYDFSIIHLFHLVVLVGVIGYFALRIPKIVGLPDRPPEERATGALPGAAFDGLTAATYLWIFVALFGVILQVVFWI